MLTIKHIRADGTEHLCSTTTARYEPRAGAPHSDGAVYSDSDAFTAGTVFVMNDYGKTVARYDLGASPVPIVGDGLSDPRGQKNFTTGQHIAAPSMSVTSPGPRM